MTPPAMTPERWTILQSVFDRISDLPLEERERALKESCPDEEIELEVRKLIAQMEEAKSWLEVPPPAARAPFPASGVRRAAGGGGLGIANRDPQPREPRVGAG